MILTAFGDDSADESKQRVFAVASVIASEEIWQPLEAAWIERTGGIPFHATDCECDQGDYKDRPHHENLALYKDLVTILANSDAWGFGVAVDLAGHRDFFPGVKEELSYHNCFVKVINFALHRCADLWKAEQIQFSFDNRLETNFNATYAYSLLLNDPTQPYRELLSDEISFICSRKNPRIQMGDLYARECMKHLDNMVGPKKREERKSMSALTQTRRFGGDFYMREYFQDMRARTEEIQKKAGFTQRDYIEWLHRENLIDNVTNMFRFLTVIDKGDLRGIF